MPPRGHPHPTSSLLTLNIGEPRRGRVTLAGTVPRPRALRMPRGLLLKTRVAARGYTRPRPPLSNTIPPSCNTMAPSKPIIITPFHPKRLKQYAPVTRRSLDDLSPFAPDQLIELQGCAPPFSSQPDGYHLHSKHEPGTDAFNTTRDSGMGRLEALVAVATSEN